MPLVSLRKGIAVLAVLAAAVFAVGIRAQAADAQSGLVSHGGPYTAVAGVPVRLQATVSPAFGIAHVAQWSLGNGQQAHGLAPTVTYARPGVYTVMLTVVNTYGAVDTVQTTVTVHGAAPMFFAPTALNGCVYGTTVVNGITYCVGTVTTGCPYGTTVVNGVVYCAGSATTGCAYGVVLVNGVYHCAGTVITTNAHFQRVAALNPACAHLWLQSGVMPACALAY